MLIGDGDYGNNMVCGMVEYKIVFDKKVLIIIMEIFKVLFMVLILKVGGVFGFLYGIVFMNMIKVIKDLEIISLLE